MAGAWHLYVHIPFCTRKCRYCDFYSVQCDPALVKRYVEAVVREWRMVRKRHVLGDETPETIYFGGGTPSVLSVEQWEALVHGLGISSAVEWTLECNPESFDDVKVRAWTGAGVNRLSLGVQSLRERELRLLGRQHTAEQACRALRDPAVERFASVGVDVMYGLPGQRMGDVLETLEQLIRMPRLEHISAYELTLSPHSPLGRHRRLLPLPDEDRVVAMYHGIEQALTAAGFEHYEVSNYARPGHRSRHNSAYWRHEPYVGLGPGAHSYVPPERRANVADVGEYVASVARGRLPVAFAETLARDELVREALMLGLRTVDGIDDIRFMAITGESLTAGERGRQLERLVAGGLLRRCGSTYVPTGDGMLRADALAARLS
ncbi:MAG: radical SAM family heme chaperone HemW [Chitinivibrionales bacterium]|nr:radical SAM family heme chaperone HemW [Chitinivibrionales bacterium]